MLYLDWKSLLCIKNRDDTTTLTDIKFYSSNLFLFLADFDNKQAFIFSHPFEQID